MPWRTIEAHDLVVAGAAGSSLMGAVGSAVGLTIGPASEHVAAEAAAGAGTAGPVAGQTAAPSTIISEEGAREALGCLPLQTIEAHDLVVEDLVVASILAFCSTRERVGLAR